MNWKKLSKSKGYRSLKAACIKDVTEASNTSRPMRKKEIFYKLFRWVIARAQHYAYHQNTSVEAVLNKWESGRDYWWLNYYQECRQPKLPSGRPRNVQHAKEATYIRRNMWGSDKSLLLTRLRKARQITAQAKRKALQKPERWDSARKKHRAEVRLRQG